MADGSYRPIEDVKAGDKVMAADPKSGKGGSKTVITPITSTGAKNLVQISVDHAGNKDHKQGMVVATATHPFWVPALRDWIDA